MQQMILTIETCDHFSLIWPWCTHDACTGLMGIQQRIHQNLYRHSCKVGVRISPWRWEHIGQFHWLHHAVLASATSTWGTPINPRASAASPALHKGVASAAAEALCLGEASHWYRYLCKQLGLWQMMKVKRQKQTICDVQNTKNWWIERSHLASY